jgi:hypothetical protein
MTSTDPLRAALDQLAAHGEQITQLDTRETAHYTALTGRLDEITGLVTGIGGTPREHAALLTRLEDPGRQATGLAAQPASGSAGTGRPHPDPAAAWWKLAADDRREPVARLRAWVEQVYRPGYGHLAAALAPCWPAHDLCLYGLDILAGLWSALYLQPGRSPGLLSAQAEYQARILPALAAQLMTETTGCGHPRPASPATRHPRSRP